MKVNIIKALRLNIIFKESKNNIGVTNIVPMIKSVQVHPDPRPVRVLVYRGRFNYLGPELNI